LTDSSNDSINRMQRLIDLNSEFNSVQRDTNHMNDGPKMTLIIHHQFPGIELVSPVYYSIFATCCLLPDQRVNVGTTTQIGFNIHPAQEWSIGVLMYKLQRRNTDQSNEEAISSEEATCTQLLMIWEVKNYNEFYVDLYLIEHDKRHVWDRDRLIKLVSNFELINVQDGPIEETWLMRDNAVLMTSLNATHEEERYKLEVTISEVSIKDDTLRLWHIDLDR
jgi:hypothetical protein